MTKDNRNDKQDDNSKDWPKTFKDGEFGFVKAVMLGGPRDGKRYNMTRFPDGSIPSGTVSPLQQPHETSLYAHYERAGEEPIGGYYVFLYTETRDTDGKVMAEEDPAATTRASETCEGFLQHPLATDELAHPEVENS